MIYSNLYTRLKNTQLKVQILIPSSKSQTIRALLIATFAKEKSIIHNALDSQDTQSCIKACRAFGAKMQIEKNTIFVDSKNIDSDTSDIIIDCANSGTTLYLALGLAASLKRKVTFTGDDQLQKDL